MSVSFRRVRCERPRRSRAAEKGDAFAPSHVEHRFSPVPTLMSSSRRRFARVVQHIHQLNDSEEARKAQQETLFPLKWDARPVSLRTDAGRYESSTFFKVD